MLGGVNMRDHKFTLKNNKKNIKNLKIRGMSSLKGDGGSLLPPYGRCKNITAPYLFYESEYPLHERKNV